jgi:peptidyl-prolyl cis-trans isomerase C
MLYSLSRGVAVLLVGVLSFTACSKSADTTDAPAPAPVADAAGAVPAPAGGEMPMPPGALGAAPPVKAVPAQLPAVLAKVNGEDITRPEFEKAVQNIERQAGQPVPAAERDRIYRQILDDLIRYRLVLQESKARKSSLTEADVDARLASVRKQFPDEAAFNAMLKEQNLTLAQIREELRTEMVVESLLRSEVEPKIAVTDAEISAFFKENPQNFQAPERVHASHVLIAVPEGAAAEVKTAALAKANTVLKRARSGGDFAALAKEHSEDPGSAPAGGDLGFFQAGQMVGPFNDVAFKLAPGAISDPVETQFGYHIIKVHAKEPGRVVPLDEARPRIEEHLRNGSRQKRTQEFIEGLRAKGKVDVLI